MNWQMVHLFEMKLKQEHYLIRGAFVHLWNMIFVYVLSD